MRAPQVRRCVHASVRRCLGPSVRRPWSAAILALSLACDAGLKPEIATGTCSAGFCGTVHFRGALPDSTDYVRVVAYATVPATPQELFAFAGVSDPLPIGGDAAFYTCCITALPPGSYPWVFVLWKKVGVLTPETALDLLREAGSYLNPADTTQLGTVVVGAGAGTPGIDITADFGRMRSVSDLFPAVRR